MCKGVQRHARARGAAACEWRAHLRNRPVVKDDVAAHAEARVERGQRLVDARVQVAVGAQHGE